AVVTASNASGSVMTTTLVQVTNLAPVADAGPDQEVDPGVIVTLDGSGSTDPDGHLPLDYCWSQTGGLPLVSLDYASTAAPIFTAPEEDTVLTFTLRVTDTYGLADATPDVVQIRVTDTNYEIYLPLVLRN
ncbi:MAG: PKD domain-containing protein, partial [Anaerolineae bacterium]